MSMRYPRVIVPSSFGVFFWGGGELATPIFVDHTPITCYSGTLYIIIAATLGNKILAVI